MGHFYVRDKASADRANEAKRERRPIKDMSGTFGDKVGFFSGDVHAVDEVKAGELWRITVRDGK
jgi:hypothetical protein